MSKQPRPGLQDPSPEYCIVLPAYEAKATIGRAIESVQAQTGPSWHLIIVDDGSSDATASIADGLAGRDPRITVIHQTNKGVASARNAGVEASASEFVVFLDADDELLPDYLASMDAFVRDHPGYDIYHPNLRVETGTSQATSFSQEAQVVSHGLEDLLDSCVIALGGAMVRTRLFRSLGGFLDGIHCEDYDFWLRATSTGARALYSPRTLYVYHQEGQERRSQDTRAGVTDVITSLESLIAGEDVAPDLVVRVNLAIAERKRLLIAVEEEGELRAQAARFYSWLDGVLGARSALLARRLVARTRGIVMPIRRMIAGHRRPKG